MNNTHKLLLAFIDASGYEVEEVLAEKGNEPGDAAGVDRVKYDYKVTKRSEGDAFDYPVAVPCNMKARATAVEAKPQPTYEERLKQNENL